MLCKGDVVPMQQKASSFYVTQDKPAKKQAGFFSRAVGLSNVQSRLLRRKGNQRTAAQQREEERTSGGQPRNGNRKHMLAAGKAALAFANYVPPEELHLSDDDEEGREARSGEALWSILRHRWKVFSLQSSMLGRIRDLYGEESSAESMAQGTLADGGPSVDPGNGRCFFVPDERRRQLWDLGLVVLVVYVGIVYPYRAAWDVVIEVDSVIFWWVDTVQLGQSPQPSALAAHRLIGGCFYGSAL